MIHARADYQRIQDPAADNALLVSYQSAIAVLRSNGFRRDFGTAAEAALSQLVDALLPMMESLINDDGDVMLKTSGTPIAGDEPVFLLRARDMHAPDTIRYWCERTYNRGRGNAEMARMAGLHADAMEVWQAVHGSKPADLPGQEASRG